MLFLCYFTALVAWTSAMTLGKFQDVQEDTLDNRAIYSNEPDEDPTLTSGLFEGDIYGVDPLIINGRAAIYDDEKKWENATVPYEISNEYSYYQRRQILKAMKAMETLTCCKFIPRTSEEDYIYFTKGRGCASTVGRAGGQQEVSLAPGCLKQGTILHELMHVLGFWHEQSRSDRDKYITINWKNIQKGMESNFQKYSWNQIRDLVGEYDIKSIMHYGPKAFSKNGFGYTIEPKIKRYITFMGQREKMSVLDVTKVKKLYLCPDEQSYDAVYERNRLLSDAQSRNINISHPNTSQPLPENPQLFFDNSESSSSSPERLKSLIKLLPAILPTSLPVIGPPLPFLKKIVDKLPLPKTSNLLNPPQYPIAQGVPPALGQPNPYFIPPQQLTPQLTGPVLPQVVPQPSVDAFQSYLSTLQGNVKGPFATLVNSFIAFCGSILKSLSPI